MGRLFEVLWLAPINHRVLIERMKEGQTEKRCDVEAEVIVMQEPQAKECGHLSKLEKARKWIIS